MLETKVLLMSIAQHIAHSKSTRQAYSIVRRMAEVEGMSIPDFDVMCSELEGDEKED